MNVRLVTLAVSVAVLILAIHGCGSSPLVRIFYPIELGNRANALNISKTLFLGHRVERFRVQARMFNPGRTAQWINGLTVSFVSGSASEVFSSLPPGAASDGSFFTREFAGNEVTIRIGSAGLISFDGGQPRIEILAIERRLRPSSAREDVPSVSNSGRFHSLARGNDVIAFSTGLNEAQHYRLRRSTVPPGYPALSVYVSPRIVSLNNDMGIRMHVSNTGFVAPDTNVGWTRPQRGDSGMYLEFPPGGTDVFMTVVSTAIGSYLVRSTWLVERFEDIAMQRDARMGAAPAVTRTPNSSEQSPYDAQLAAYVNPTATFDRRILETLTIGSALSLDATDGQMRFASAELYRDYPIIVRNVDIQFTICDSLKDPACRANHVWSQINMFTADLSEPVGGGWTLHHEWGHWQYGLSDEYVDVSGPPPVFFGEAIDPNSLMGTRASTEFCYPRNHLWSEDADAGEESSWTQIEDQYRGRVATVAFAAVSHGRYLDVLHQVEGLLRLTMR